MGGSTDYLTCGDCQSEFPLSNIVVFMQHKKTDCNGASPGSQELDSERYNCFTCSRGFHAAVSLLHHAQLQHELHIYKSETDCMPDPEPKDYFDSSVEQVELEKRRESSNTPDLLASVADGAIGMSDYTENSVPLSKCCTSVVPKKRKRHIETKHRHALMRAKLLRRQQQNMPSDIYIDLDQTSSHNPDTSEENQSNGHHVPAESRRLLLKPGSSFKFPGLNNKYVGISYSAPADLMAQAYTNFSTPATLVTTTAVSSATSTSVTKGTTTEPDENGAPVTTAAVVAAAAVRKKYPTSKPFKCDHCDHSFNQRIHLKKHLSKHTGVKPYKCDQCDYATVERSHLKVHIRIHTGEKPYKCDHCEYATAQNSTLKIHLKRHHGGLLLECSNCGKSFPERTELNKHKLEHSDKVNCPGSTAPVAAIPDTVPVIPAPSSRMPQGGTDLHVNGVTAYTTVTST